VNILKISLTEAINIISIIKGKLNEAYAQLDKVSTVSYAKGEEKPEKTTDVDELAEEIAVLQEDLISLSMAIDEANRSTVVDFKVNDRSLYISEAIVRAQIMRQSLRQLKKLADAPEKPVMRSSMYRSEGNYEVATFDVKTYKNIAESLEKKVNRLSLSIDKANAITSVEFANVEKYLA
jgi:hypothetical protein